MIQQELQVHGLKKRQVSSHSQKELGIQNNIVAIPGKPSVNEYSAHRGRVQKYSQIDASSAKMSEGFQQYALDLDSKRDSNIGLMRPLFRDDHS